MTILLPLAFVLVGGLMYLLATKTEYKEMGRISFFSGLLAFLLTGGQQVVSLFGG